MTNMNNYFSIVLNVILSYSHSSNIRALWLSLKSRPIFSHSDWLLRTFTLGDLMLQKWGFKFKNIILTTWGQTYALMYARELSGLLLWISESWRQDYFCFFQYFVLKCHDTHQSYVVKMFMCRGVLVIMFPGASPFLLLSCLSSITSASYSQFDQFIL